MFRLMALLPILALAACAFPIQDQHLNDSLQRSKPVAEHHRDLEHLIERKDLIMHDERKVHFNPSDIGEAISHREPSFVAPTTKAATAPVLTATPKRSLQMMDDSAGDSCENPIAIHFNNSNNNTSTNGNGNANTSGNDNGDIRTIVISNQPNYTSTLPSSTVVDAKGRSIIWFSLQQGDDEHNIQIQACRSNNDNPFLEVITYLFRDDNCETLFHLSDDDRVSGDLSVCPSQSVTATNKDIFHARPGKRYLYQVRNLYDDTAIDDFVLYIERFAKPADPVLDGRSCNSAIPLEFTANAETKVVIISDGSVDTSSLPSDALVVDGTFRTAIWFSVQGSDTQIAIQDCPEQGWNIQTSFFISESCANIYYLPWEDLYGIKYPPTCPVSSPLQSGVQPNHFYYVRTGETYYYHVRALGDSTLLGNMIIYFETLERMSNDNPENAIQIEMVEGRADYTGDFRGAISSYMPCDEDFRRSAWYTLEGNGRRIIISTCSEHTTLVTGINANTIFMPSNTTASTTSTDVYPECYATGFSTFGCDSTDMTTANLILDTQQGLTYLLAVVGYGFYGDVNTFGLSIREVDVPDPPANDDCSNPSDIELVDGEFRTIGTTVGANPAPGDFDPKESVFYRMIGTGNSMIVSTCSERTSIATELLIFDGNCTNIFSSTSFGLYLGECDIAELRDLRLVFSQPGQEYVIMVSSKVPLISGEFELIVQSLTPPENNGCEDATTIDLVDGMAEISGTMAGASLSAQFADEFGNADVWYTFPGRGDAFVVSTCFDGVSNGYHATVEIYVGSCQDLSAPSVSRQSGFCSGGSEQWSSHLAFGTVPGQQYFVRVYKYMYAVADENDQFQVQLESVPLSNLDVCGADIQRPSFDGVVCTDGDACEELFPSLDAFSECEDSCLHSDISGQTFATKITLFTYKGRGEKDAQITYRFVDSSVREIRFYEFSNDNDRCRVTVDGALCNSCSMGACGRYAMDCSNIMSDSSNVDLCDESSMNGLADDSIFRFFYTEDCANVFILPNVECEAALGIGDDQIIGTAHAESIPCDRDSHRWYRYVGKGTVVVASTCHISTTFDTQLTVISNGCDAAEFVVENDDSVQGCPFNMFASSVHWFAEAGVEYIIDLDGLNDYDCGAFRLTLEELEVPPPHAKYCVESMKAAPANGFVCSCEESSPTFTRCSPACPEVCNADGTICGQEYYGSASNESGDPIFEYNEFRYAQGEYHFAGYEIYDAATCDVYFAMGDSLDYLYCATCEMQDCGDGTMAPVADCSGFIEDMSIVDFCQYGQAFESGPFVAFSPSIAFEKCEITEVPTDQASVQPSQLAPSNLPDSITPLPTVTSTANKASIPTQSPIETSTLTPGLGVAGTTAPSNLSSASLMTVSRWGWIRLVGVITWLFWI